MPTNNGTRFSKKVAALDYTEQRAAIQRNHDRYKYIRHVESMKANRRVLAARTQVQRAEKKLKHPTGRSEAEVASLIATANATLTAAAKDVEYVKFFPASVRYVSLYPKEDSDESRRRRDEMRPLIARYVERKTYRETEKAMRRSERAAADGDGDGDEREFADMFDDAAFKKLTDEVETDPVVAANGAEKTKGKGAEKTKGKGGEKGKGKRGEKGKATAPGMTTATRSEPPAPPSPSSLRSASPANGASLATKSAAADVASPRTQQKATSETGKSPAKAAAASKVHAKKSPTAGRASANWLGNEAKCRPDAKGKRTLEGEEKTLHPSWQARLKEQNVAFAGQKTTFDSDSD